MDNGMVISWFSGGVTSAVAGKICLDIFGESLCRFVFIDTNNEDDDTYRFLGDCQNWYGKEIEIISNNKYNNIQEVWTRFKSLNVAGGAICSSELKREVRRLFLKENDFKYNAFGFDINEPKRSLAMKINYPEINPIFPLLLFGLTKKKCVNILQENNILIPKAYLLGYRNNNCFKTGCVQGGIGYWQKIKEEFPEKFFKMAEMEHQLTSLAGKPVTILKDQGKNGGLVFLMPNSEYPEIKDISMMKGRPVEPIIECNGFCGTYDLRNIK